MDCEAEILIVCTLLRSGMMMLPPLTAAVLCRNEQICSYLLKESADPNKPSTNGLTPLQYAAQLEFH